MNSSSGKNGEPKEIDVEIVNETPAAPKTEPSGGFRTFFHPLSGLMILLIDWLAFGLDLPTGFIFIAFISLAAFLSTFAVVYLIQRRESGDSPPRARWKALLGAIAAGVPFPITGTILGASILLLSGLPISPKTAILDVLKPKK